MAIITYWNDGKVETAQSVTVAAVATAIALKYDYRVLIVNTKCNDESLERAFEPKNSMNSIFTRGKIDIATGLSGLAKAIISNKTSPEIITNYTKVIWKNLELLTEKNAEEGNFNKYITYIKEIIKLANNYYDIVLVDLEGAVYKTEINEILNDSDVIIATLVQNINVLDRFIELKEKNRVLEEKNIIVSLGKYNEKSKYTVKNVSKYIKEKNVLEVPYNTMISMDAPEGRVADFIVNFRKVKESHINAPFIFAINKQVEKIIDTIKT